MNDQAPASLGAQIWDGAGKGPGVVIILGVLYTGLVWGIGPIKPQSQVDSDAQKAAVTKLSNDFQTATTKLEATQQAQAATCAADKVLLTNRIDSAQQLFTSRLDAMWRPSDYTERDTHLSRLDSVFEALRDRVVAQEYATKDLKDRLSGLSAAPVRNPGH